MSEKLELAGELLLGIIMVFAIIGILGSLLTIPGSALYMIWIDFIFGVKIFGSAIVILLTSVLIGEFAKKAHDDLYEEGEQ